MFRESSGGDGRERDGEKDHVRKDTPSRPGEWMLAQPNRAERGVGDGPTTLHKASQPQTDLKEGSDPFENQGGSVKTQIMVTF